MRLRPRNSMEEYCQNDLSVKPDTLGGTIFEPINLPESCDLDAIKQVTINVTRKEILDLLKCSLFSMTPLTDVFLKKNLVIENMNTQSTSSFDTDCGDQKSISREKKITVKLLMLPIDEASAINYGCYSKKEMYGEVRSSLVASDGCSWSFIDTCVHLEYLEPQSSTGEAYNRFAIGGRGFTKKPALYMVSDDLIVTPGSSSSAISILTKLRIPLSDVMECSIDIGKNESLSIVKASLISSSALTNGFGLFLAKFT
ncbi:hypothetical protein TSUD_177650 [Trifolium subterraneum]|uniref:Uncharacterized protein n=1 Tax=Trifolium subterraneum TaxID=3900 RepID=A0A2Z6P541_TRISU|nr:hypothetical protein TSUD_177650 [Trifolium subterraneum]